jgi:GntR family transcriptional regulator
MAKPRRLALQLDFHSGQPAYLQIVRLIEEQIGSGRLRPGDQLPTVRDLAGQLGLNFNTAARAYHRLHQAGVVSTQRGRGTYVVGRASASARRRRRGRTLQQMAQGFVEGAREHRFSEAEIAAAVERLLKATTPGA